MTSLISERAAVNGILVILSLIVLFHLAVVLGIIPFGIVWGGRLTSRAEMLRFEAISLSVNMVLIALVAVKGGLLRVAINPMVLKIAFWLMAGIFLLNTLGNLLSTSMLEKVLFTPLTLILAILSFRLAISR